MKIPKVSRVKLTSIILAFTSILFGFLLVRMVSGSYTTEGLCTLVEGTPNTFVGNCTPTATPTNTPTATPTATPTPTTTTTATPKQNVLVNVPIAKVTSPKKK